MGAWEMLFQLLSCRLKPILVLPPNNGWKTHTSLWLLAMVCLLFVSARVAAFVLVQVSDRAHPHVVQLHNCYCCLHKFDK